MAKSHLLPRWSYPDNNDMKVISANPEIRPKRMPVGVYDSDILCSECEGRYQQIDSDACCIFKSDAEWRRCDYGKNECVYVSNDNDLISSKVASFFLFTLWKYSVSSLKEARAINIGRTHEDGLKRAIKEKKPFSYDGVSIFLTRYKTDKIRVPHVFPIQKIEQCRFWSVGIPGWCAKIKTDSRKMPSVFSELVLKPNSNVVALEVDWHETAEARAMVSLVRKSINAHGFPFKKVVSMEGKPR